MNYYLVNLSIADLLITLWCPAHSLVKELTTSSQYLMPALACKIAVFYTGKRAVQWAATRGVFVQCTSPHYIGWQQHCSPHRAEILNREKSDWTAQQKLTAASP